MRFAYEQERGNVLAIDLRGIAVKDGIAWAVIVAGLAYVICFWPRGAAFLRKN